MYRLLIIPLLIGFCFRSPMVDRELPYFYNEDEAHHFNRVANMVKSGSFNPEYFHKPSLHFYLRMPVLAASFLWNVREGHIKTLDELRTTDNFGVAKYAFTASHPGIVKWNRMFSLLLSLGMIAASVIAVTLIFPKAHAVFPIGAGLLAALSPPLIRESAMIGVDPVFSFFTLLASLLCLVSLKNSKYLLWASISAGLAVSSKYNALPIIFVPVLTSILLGSYRRSFLLLALSLAAFILGSPYILAELPLFLNQFAYEIWHYKIAGHVGNEGTPGISQALFYMKWLKNDGMFIPGLILALIGLFKFNRQLFVWLSFPALFFLLMIDQKVNFTRNMSVIIPYLCVLVGAGGYFIYERLRFKVVLISFIPIILILPMTEAFILISSKAEDTRDQVEFFLKESLELNKKVFIAGELQLSPYIYRYPQVKVFKQEGSSLEALIAEGAEVIVFFNPAPTIDLELVEPIIQLAGLLGPQRIVKNPSLSIYKVRK